VTSFIYLTLSQLLLQTSKEIKPDSITVQV